MTLNFIPGNREVVAILAAQVQGPYHFVHDALKPYVQLAPAVPGTPIVVTSSPTLQLLGQAKSREVSDTMTLVIMFQGSGLHLVEVLPIGTTNRAVGVPRALPLDHVDVQVVSEGDHPEARPLPRAPLIRLAPERSAEPVPPSPRIPAGYAAWCATHDVHPELGDYLVVPILDQGLEPKPAWVIRTPSVSVPHVVKPRLGTDEVMTDGF